MTRPRIATAQNRMEGRQVGLLLSAIQDCFWDDLMTPSAAQLERTRVYWTPHAGYELTLEDAAEIHRNFFGLLKLLSQIDARRR